MRPMRFFFLLLASGAAAACGSIPNDPPPPGGRGFAPAGVLQGTVVYSGPHPCSMNGHIVGAAILYVFDRRNPPPPAGLASTPVNFGVVTGDALFASEPRNPGSIKYCPDQNGITDTVTVSAPFSIAPLAGGSYLIQSFYDSTGNFLPNFKFSNLPEKGDIGGGDIDTADALKPMNASNPNYQPHFLPVDVGTPLLPLDAGIDGDIPNYSIPADGIIVGNLTVTVGADLGLTRPYFYPAGMAVSFDPTAGTLSATEAQSSAAPPTSLTNIRNTASKDANFDPVLTIPQDLQVLAAPVSNMVQGNVNNFESKLPRLLLHGNLPVATDPKKSEYATAIAPPFNFQVGPTATGAFTVWQNALFDNAKQKWVPQDIPEGGGVPQLWPLVVLTKLIDDPTHTLDPSSITQQGSPTAPVVILQGITLLGGNGMDATQPDSLFNSGQAEAFGELFDPPSGQPIIFSQDHLTVLVRPAVICFNTLFDPNNPDKRGTIVAPYIVGTSADLTGATTQPIVPPSILSSPALSSLVNGMPLQACMPVGRYAINVIYPDGQAWTVPNESGACSGAEGATNYTKLSCTLQPRPILYSQGTRAVVEIVKATDPTHCTAKSVSPAPAAPPPVCSVQ
jgi:hypothetical protein